MKMHELKIEQTYFDATKRGDHKVQIRKNDRDFTIGDMLYLREWQPLIGAYTDRSMSAFITFVAHDSNLPNDYVALSIRIVK